MFLRTMDAPSRSGHFVYFHNDDATPAISTTYLHTVLSGRQSHEQRGVFRGSIGQGKGSDGREARAERSRAGPVVVFVDFSARRIVEQLEFRVGHHTGNVE